MNKITRRKFIGDVGKGISFAALAPYLSSCEFLNEDELPNIVLIFMDDLGYADIGSFGAKGYSTPNLDKLAEEGMILTDFHAATAVCSASRAALLTGCYSERVSIRGALNHSATIGLNPNEENIARLLKKKNYKTGIIGKWHLGHHKQFLPLQQGFDEFYGLPYSNDMWPVGYDGKPLTESWKAGYPELKLIEGNEQVEAVKKLEDQDQLTTKYTNKAVDFINRNSKNKFFLYFAHSMPHVPLGVSDKFKGKSEQGKFGDVIMEIDWSVGEVMKTLKENGIEENTLIIFTSDNGPWLNYGNHAGSADPLREGKGTMWEGGNRVPCVVKWPNKIKPNSKNDKMSSTIDILPTIAEITNSNLPKNKIDGISIFPLFMNEKNANPRNEFWYYYDYDLIAVRKNEWKLYFPCTQRSYEGMEPGKDGYPGPTWQKKMDYELYNLKEDIEEQKNVIDKYPDIVENLKKIGDKARNELGDRLTKTKGKENRPPGRIGEDRVKNDNHLAVGKNIKLKYIPHKRYQLSDQSLLIDGWKGSYDYNDGNWIGFEGTDFEAIIDLSYEMPVSNIEVSFLENQISWIFQPEKVEILISRDNINFQPIAKFENKVKPNMVMEAHDYKKAFNSTSVRFIKVSAKNITECPSWHPGKGGKAWLFVDEIVVK
ncbi:MAG: sulfatase [Ignavibacteriae bacterium]|nr:sulfatase [Ignavibacteriota bacterium]MCB9208884.1 sulfatase [Ignavibacteriales bacterium]MCB9218198.1 sulfatase [Ignavibacteriales bacterium]MCB9260699.1 sulfatase [Ignavibacteriales bacterium]